MRNTFVETLTELAEYDERIVLLIADLGYKIFDTFKEKFPKRFYNVGIAEQNMIGMASGLAQAGFKPFVYSIAPFCTSRCYEQIRNDIAYHNRNVIIVGFGGGLTYGHGGPSHHAIEDIAIFRPIPNMQIICPGDIREVAYFTEYLSQRDGSYYFRLSGIGGIDIHGDSINLEELDCCFPLSFGLDLQICSTGNMLLESVKLKEILEEKEIHCGIVSCPMVKPLTLVRSIFDAKYVISLEEHNILGGFGSAIAEYIAENDNIKCKFRRYGINDSFARVSGDSNYLRQYFDLNAEKIAEDVLKWMKKK